MGLLGLLFFALAGPRPVVVASGTWLAAIGEDRSSTSKAPPADIAGAEGQDDDDDDDDDGDDDDGAASPERRPDPIVAPLRPRLSLESLLVAALEPNAPQLGREEDPP